MLEWRPDPFWNILPMTSAVCDIRHGTAHSAGLFIMRAAICSVTTLGATMRLKWDLEKNSTNLRKHGLNFADAAEMFAGPFLARPDIREDYGEERWIGVGMTKGRVALVAFTVESDETIRIISLRKATNEERQEYEAAIKDGLEAN
jgi:uncharacterized protein